MENALRRAFAVSLCLSACSSAPHAVNALDPGGATDAVTVVTSLNAEGFTCFEMKTPGGTQKTCNNGRPADFARVQLYHYSSLATGYVLMAIGTASVVSKPADVEVVMEGEWVIIYDPNDRLSTESLTLSVDGRRFKCEAP